MSIHYYIITLLLTLTSCTPKNNEIVLLPPATFPLSRPTIAYGVVNTNYTHLLESSDVLSGSSGFLRRGDIVRILERKLVRKGEGGDYWDLCENLNDGRMGWMRQDALQIYERLEMAETAGRELRE
jgi:hypothetical protein